MAKKKRQGDQDVPKQTGSCLYDFNSETPEQPKTSVQKTKSTRLSKPKPKKNPASDKKSVCPKKRELRDKLVLVETPKCSNQVQTVFQQIDSSQALRGKRNLRHLKPLPPPNLDDISPIVAHQVKKTAQNVDNKPKAKQVRRSPRQRDSNNTSSTSRDMNDSGLFLSPRKPVPRLSSGKTSTPASVQQKQRNKLGKRSSSKTEHVTKTSTPLLNTEIKTYTSVKSKRIHVAESPIQRTETPTSDYGSMQSVDLPSPSPVQKGRYKRSHSPAFTLEDDEDDKISLNKSIEDKVYKKTKRSYEHSKKSESKLEEWAERVNSELEDIENFELSVEG